MGWLRENWFDALLFVLLAAVVVAIVLFLTGVNPFAPRTTTGAVETATVEQKPPPAPPPAKEVKEEAKPAEPPAPAEEGVEVTVLPLPPALEEGAGEAKEETKPKAEKPAPAPAPKPAPKPKTVEKPAGGGIYRVSVGAFSQAEHALELAKKLRAEGYPVRIEVVGQVSRVVVGPYTSRAEAERVQERLAEYQPQIYRGDTPLPQGNYLQVGAFRNLDSAKALAAELKAKGYPVVVYYRDGLAKVWVGPYDAAMLPEVKVKLEAEGYEVVEVRGG